MLRPTFANWKNRTRSFNFINPTVFDTHRCASACVCVCARVCVYRVCNISIKIPSQFVNTRWWKISENATSSSGVHRSSEHWVKREISNLPRPHKICRIMAENRAKLAAPHVSVVVAHLAPVCQRSWGVSSSHSILGFPSVVRYTYRYTY